jgi:predicted RNase H-like HicB family nuclease
MTQVEYTVIIEPADDGTFSVYVPDLPGCVSTGRTREDAIDSIREAIQGHVRTLRELGEAVPPPRSQSHIVAA